MGCVFGIFFWSRIPGEKIPRWAGTSLLLISVSGMFVLTSQGINAKGSYFWYLHKGLQAFEKGKVQDAETHLLKAKKIKSKPYVVFKLASLHFQNRNYPKAQEYYHQLLKKQPGEFRSGTENFIACTK